MFLCETLFRNNGQTGLRRKDMIYTITDETFDAETNSGLVLIDFWATWCGPCKIQGPILEKLSNELSGDELKICKLEVDENPLMAEQHGILSIPTLLFKKEGNVVKQVSGVHSKDQILKIVEEI